MNWRDVTHPLAGGSEIHIHQMAKHWIKRGHEVTLFTSSYKGCKSTEYLDGIKTIRRGNRYTVYIAAMKYYHSIAKIERYNAILESINTIPFFTPIYVKEPITALIYSLGNKKVLFKELPLRMLPASFAGYLAGSTLPRIYQQTVVTAISDSSKKELVASGFESKRVFVSYPGLGDRFLKIARRIPSDDRPNHRIVYVGRIKRYKCLSDLIFAMKYVLKKLPDAELYIVGKGEFLEELKKLANSLGLSKAVKFCGFVSEEEKVRILKSSSVFVCLSIDEGGWTIAALEALACGTPIIVTESQKDVVRPDDTGYLVSYSNPKVVADRIISVLKNPILWRRMSRKSMLWAKQFTWDKTADITLEAIKFAIATNASKRFQNCTYTS